MAKKTKTVIGIEYDSSSVRAVAVEHEPDADKTIFFAKQFERIDGDFTSDENLQAALVQIKDQMAGSPNTTVATCVAGKQVYAVQMRFRKLKAEETRKALRLEIRKSLPFDASTAAVEYQILSEKDDERQILVTAVADSILSRQLKVMEKAGLVPQIVDTLPTCIADAFFTSVRHAPPDKELASVILHVGPNVVTLVITGDQAPFFHRNIYFSATELFGGSGSQEPPPAQERKRRLGSLTDEVMRTVAYYQKTFNARSVPEIYLLGLFTNEPELTGVLAENIGLPVEVIDQIENVSGAPAEKTAEFALALVLAMRED